MSIITDVEVCLEINCDTEESIRAIEERYDANLISRNDMATEISLVIYTYLMKNNPILVKILKPAN